MIYIIAGNQNQAQDWIKKSNLKEREEVKYIHSEYQLRGLSNGIVVVFIGTFYEHINIDKLLFMLSEMQAIKLTEIKL